MNRSFERDWQQAHPFPPPSRSIVELVRRGTLDAELAGLVWLMLDARVPLLVAGGPRLAGKSTLLTALLDFLPPSAERIVLRGEREDFAWLDLVDASRGYLLASELSGHAPHYVWGRSARTAVRAIGRGFGLGATLHSDSLEGVFSELQRPPVGLSDDELSLIGVVLILGALASPDPGGEPRRRVIAAHYVRPVARDAGGHIQRLGPAVLATLDLQRDAFEHFAWGITPELALRVGRRPGDFEHEHARRTDFLAGLAAAGIDGPFEVRRAIAGYSVVPALSTS